MKQSGYLFRFVPEAVSPETWRGLGAWYAANGEYACAADAYARAYAAQPDPDFALEAGQPIADVAGNHGAGYMMGNAKYPFAMAGAFCTTAISESSSRNWK